MVSLELVKFGVKNSYCLGFSSIVFHSVPFSVLVSKGYDNTILSDVIPWICIFLLGFGICLIGFPLLKRKLEQKSIFKKEEKEMLPKCLNIFRIVFFLYAFGGAILAGIGAVHPDEYTLGKIGNVFVIFGLVGGELSSVVKEEIEAEKQQILNESFSDEINQLKKDLDDKINQSKTDLNNLNTSLSNKNDELNTKIQCLEQIKKEIQQLQNQIQTPIPPYRYSQ